MKIALMQLSLHYRPYKNPFRLQALCVAIQKLFPECDVFIYDADAACEIPATSIEVAVVDTTETSVCDIATTLRTTVIQNLLLFGDVVCYGEGGAAKAFLEQCCSDTRVWLTTEMDIMDDLVNLAFHGISSDSSSGGNDCIVHSAFREKGLQYMAKGVSDGCEMRCSFCRHSCSDEPVRCFSCPSLPDIQALYLACRTPVFVQFSDENFFGISQHRLSKVLELAKELRLLDGSFRFGVDTRIDSIVPSFPLPQQMSALHKECLQEMLGAGLKYCFLGVESFSPAQLRRYNKDNDLMRVCDCLRFFELHDLAFTFGLILWDPLMTKEDLRINLSAIQSLGILGRTASLWKPLRIPMKSLYRKRYLVKATCKQSDDFLLLKEDIGLYCDLGIQAMAQYIFPLYHLFDRCGYRHSDASSFSVLLEKNDPAFLKQIPFIIADLEMTVLEDLLNHSELTFSKTRATDYYQLCAETCKTIINGLENVCENCSMNAAKVRHYYLETFSRLNHLIHNIWLIPEKNTHPAGGGNEYV